MADGRAALGRGRGRDRERMAAAANKARFWAGGSSSESESEDESSSDEEVMPQNNKPTGGKFGMVYESDSGRLHPLSSLASLTHPQSLKKRCGW